MLLSRLPARTTHPYSCRLLRPLRCCFFKITSAQVEPFSLSSFATSLIADTSLSFSSRWFYYFVLLRLHVLLSFHRRKYLLPFPRDKTFPYPLRSFVQSSKVFPPIYLDFIPASTLSRIEKLRNSESCMVEEERLIKYTFLASSDME